MKRFLVRLRKIKRMILLPEPDFDKEYIKRRRSGISDEINSLPFKERFKFVEGLKSDVAVNMTKECEKAKVIYEELSSMLKENNIYL